MPEVPRPHPTPYLCIPQYAGVFSRTMFCFESDFVWFSVSFFTAKTAFYRPKSPFLVVGPTRPPLECAFLRFFHMHFRFFIFSFPFGVSTRFLGGFALQVKKMFFFIPPPPAPLFEIIPLFLRPSSLSSFFRSFEISNPLSD